MIHGERIAKSQPWGEPDEPASAGAGPVPSNAPPSAAPIAGRQRALAPHFERFMAWWSAAADPVPHIAELDLVPIELGSWERAVLKTARGVGNSSSKRDLGLVGEAVAYQVMSMEFGDRLERGPTPSPADLPAFLDRLVLHLAVGMAIEAELQWDIDRLIAGGRLADAKSLSELRGKVARSLSGLKGQVGSSQLAEAERRAGELVSVEKAVETASRDELCEEPPPTPNWATYKLPREAALPPWLSEGLPEAAGQPPKTAARAASRTKPLLFVLAGLLAMYGIVMMPRLATQGPPPLGLEQFSHVEAVQAVLAKPPSLYVVLHRAAWDAGTPAERQALLEEIGRVADAAGYRGVHARTDDGVTVGQWLKQSGVAIRQRPGSPS